MGNLRPAAFTNLLLQTVSGGTSVTLKGLFESLELSDEKHLFDKIDVVNAALKEHQLELLPPIGHGDEKTERRLKSLGHQPIDEETIREICLQIEDAKTELKSSLFFDYNREASGNFIKLSDLKSENVIHSALKTICGFLNTAGGRLLIGVDNSGKILGLKNDCRLLNEKEMDLDKWELSLRNLIVSKFKDGLSVSNFIDRKIVDTADGAVCILEVTPRKNLSFVKKTDGNFSLYTRRGNNTEEVAIEDIEDFLVARQEMNSS